MCHAVVPSAALVMDLPDFIAWRVLRDAASNPPALHCVQVCHLLLAQLHDLLDPTIEGHSQLGHLRVVQRCSRTVLRRFHSQLGAKCGAFTEVLLSGAAPASARGALDPDAM